MKITVFGGASLKPGETAYEEARELGYQLGKQGHTLLTGGYIGTMEAVSKGASEAGAHVIGSTCADIEAWRGTRANEWVKEEWKHATLRDRMYALVDACDIAIVLPGGIGTLAELAVFWNEEVISQKPSRQVLLIGEGWKNTIQMFFDSFVGFINSKDQNRVHFVESVQSAVDFIASMR